MASPGMKSLIAFGVLALLAAPAAARKPLKQDLSNTGIDPNARGRAQLVLRADDNGKFEVAVHKLDRNSKFEVLVNAVKVGTLTTNHGGNGRVRFRSRPRGEDLVLGFDPRSGHVEVRNGDGQDVLEADIPAGDDNPNDVVCCIPDDRGAECEDRTADECAQAGGTVSTATSCLPNPCDTTPPPAGGDDVVCCITGGGGEVEVECEDRTQAECATAGATVVSATSCTPSPCNATPPPGSQIVCCEADDRGAECEVRTPERCAELGGTVSDATSCMPNPCAGATSTTLPGDDNGGGKRGPGN
jgi:hypothetical protein